MSAASLLSGLYPPAVRERWGEDITREVAASGMRSWPDTLMGAARLWLHPGDWPESFPGQTRRVLTVTLFAVAGATGLLLRTVAPSAALTADVHRPLTSLWVAPLALGAVLALPLPPPNGRALRRLVVLAVRTLAAPASAVAVLVLAAWSGMTAGSTGVTDAGQVAYYWLTLGFVALRLCSLVARTARTAAPPSTRRLSAALLFLGTGLGLLAAQSVVELAGAGPSPGTAARTLLLGALAASAISAGRDLRPGPARAPRGFGTRDG